MAIITMGTARTARRIEGGEAEFWKNLEGISQSVKAVVAWDSGFCSIDSPRLSNQ